MSRIGKLPIKLPEGVKVEISPENIITVKGKLGQLSEKVHPSIKIIHQDNTLIFERQSDAKNHKAFHGLYRSLVYNMVIGVSEGHRKELEIVGVGYKAQATGQLLELSLGFSHNILFELPKEVKVETVAQKGKNPQIILTSIDKQLLGVVAAKIRSLRKPDAYKGKGIRYVDEVIKLKPGKSIAK